VFDRLTILVQQVAEKTSRALTVAISSGASTALPPPVANNLLGWDALGASIINYAGMASAAVSAAMAPIVSAATTAAARVGLGAAASGANTDITSLASPALGSATATTQAASDNSTKVATTAFVAGTQTATDARYAGAMPNFTALTTSALISASLGVGKVDFRNAVLATGTPVEYNVTSTLTLAMNSTAASLGATTGVQTRLVYALIYGAGTPQLSVANASGGLQMDESNLITTAAMDAGSTSATTWYSTSAIAASSQYKIVGFVDATWTSGTGWSNPVLVQPAGGLAMTNISIGKTVKDMTASRVLGNTYYNTSPWPRKVSISASGPGANTVSGTLFIDGIVWSAESLTTSAGQTFYWNLTGEVPPGKSYSVTPTASTLYKWIEEY
jgi:hypothetical protein